MNNLKDKNLYYVGGVVRDEIIKRPCLDTDLCYEGNAITFAKTNNLNIIRENPAFGTVRIKDGNDETDIASTRTEIYPQKGHLPVITKIGCSLREDLNRRDFTINSIAKNTVTGELIDYFNGKDDINSKLLRVLHNNSFEDDPTRIVRALKFSVRFGFELEENTKILRDKYLQNINYDMSYHRLKKELLETFSINNGREYDDFVNQNIYKLLSSTKPLSDIKGKDIAKIVKNETFNNPQMLYLGLFNLNKLPLTRGEKKIIEWVERLKFQSPTNNTPKESIYLAKFIGITLC
ncbi:MAG: hypothetical protein MJ237_05905 [bacterium]|nr:hypothetical protein [bacterium]